MNSAAGPVSRALITTSFVLACLLLSSFVVSGSADARPGSRDASFGAGGVARSPVEPGGQEIPRNSARESGGSIVVVGSSKPGPLGLVSRFLPDGTPDPGFGSAGKVKGGASRWDGVSLQSDGRIVVSGTSGDEAVLARYDSDGGLDPGFGSGGVVALDPQPLLSEQFADREIEVAVRDLKVLDDGSVRAIGTYFKCGWDLDSEWCTNLMMVGLNPDGTPAPGFGPSGLKPLPQGGMEAAAVMLDDGGAIVVRYSVFDGSHTFGALFVTSKVDSAGELVPGYGGIRSFDDSNLELSPGPSAAALDGEGRLLVALEHGLLRFDSDGREDRFAEPDGYLAGSSLGSYIGHRLPMTLTDIEVDPQGRILLAAGLRNSRKDKNQSDVWASSGVVARLLPDGRPDATFSGDGVAPLWRGRSSGTAVARHFSGSLRLHSDDSGSLTIAGLGPVGESFGMTLGRVKLGDAPLPTCDDRPADFVGTPGDDRVKSVGDDVIVTYGGNDSIKGFRSTVCSGSGRDRIEVKDGRNLVWAGSGNDTVEGGPGRDRLYGGPGRDRVSGNGHDDRLGGGEGNDILLGKGRDDRIFGGRGSDLLEGGSGRDQLFGGPGRDRLRPGPTGPQMHTYTSRKPNLKLSVTRSHGRVKASLNIHLRCWGDGQPGYRDYPDFVYKEMRPIKVNGSNGRFRFRSSPAWRNWQGEISMIEDIKGRFHGKLVNGYFQIIDSDHLTDNYTCWSGKNYKNPWARFKARLEPRQRQFARQ